MKRFAAKAQCTAEAAGRHPDLPGVPTEQLAGSIVGPFCVGSLAGRGVYRCFECPGILSAKSTL